MANPFSEGLMTGYSVLETMRDRRDARANEARRISLAEAANARANDMFRVSEDERSRLHANEDRARRVASARARVLRDPDNIDDDDLAILEEGGDADTIARVESYGDRRDFTTASLGDLASRAQQAAYGQPEQAPPRGGRPLPFSPGEEEFLSPNADSELAPSRVGYREVPLDEIAPFLSDNDPYKRSPMDINEGAAAQRGLTGPGSSHRNTRPVPIPEGVMTPAEINELPLVEQDAARAKLREAMTGRPEWWRNREAETTWYGQNSRQTDLDTRYMAMTDSTKDSEIRQLAAQQPTAWIAQYAKDRNSLSENARAIVDRRVQEISQQSLANLRQQARNVPVVNGSVDFDSPEGQILKRGLEQNIALLSKVEAGFSAADAANIRGGYMPVGNRELTARVTAAWQEQPPPARPSTPTEERLLRTDINRIADGTTPARKISTATINRLGKAVARGWLDYKDAESILLTGRVPQAALQFNTASPKEDVFVGGRLIRRGFDAEAARAARDKATEAQREYVEQAFELGLPGDEDWQKEERGRRMGQFWTRMYQTREDTYQQHGFDPLNTDIPHTAALVNSFLAQDKADNEWDKGLLGTRRWLYGPMEDQAPFNSDEALQLTRDLLPDQYGVFSLGNVQFRAELARQRLLETGDPRDRAAVIATEGHDEALLEYMKQNYPEAFPGGAPQE